MSKFEYVPLYLPKPLVEEMEIWRQAYCAAYNRTLSYGEMIRGMIDCLSETEPAVVDEMEAILDRNPELEKKMYVYRSNPGEDAESE